MALDVRNAVIAAQNHFTSLRDMMGFGTEDLRLEEAELSEDKKYWFITLGFTRPGDKNKNPLGDLIGNLPDEREYKVFKIDAQSGEVQSMKIREL
ncbi:MAG TPA: hypothetical protein DCS91_19420 [Microcoleaceae bacterium UBA11344]|jgi:hypothetical protein|nr:hypothetical protein [Microcoleaceae cyanobacterium UBA11344]